MGVISRYIKPIIIIMCPGLSPDLNVTVGPEDYEGPLPSEVEEMSDPLLWLSWVFVATAGCYLFAISGPGRRAGQTIHALWIEHQHID